MRLPTLACLLALTQSCSLPFMTRAPASEADERARLQRELDASCELHVSGRALDDRRRPCDAVAAIVWPWQGSVGESVELLGDGAFRLALHPLLGEETQPAPRLHVIDRAGRHWQAQLDLSRAPASGRHSLGDVTLSPEGPAARGVVVGPHGEPQPGALVLLRSGQPGSSVFETVTDAAGEFRLCPVMPVSDSPTLVVRQPGFAPTLTSLTDRVQLVRGGDVVGRVKLPQGIRSEDVELALWDNETDLGGEMRERSAEISCPVNNDGTFEMRGVPEGSHTITLRDRLARAGLASLHAEVRNETVVRCEDLAVDPDAMASRPLRVHLLDVHGEPLRAREGYVCISDVGVRRPILGGVLTWLTPGGIELEPFGFEVRGYGRTERGLRQDGQTVQLPGGYPIAFRLGLESARSLPCCSGLELRVTPMDGSQDVLYEDADPRSACTVLRLNRDALVTAPSPGRYKLQLILLLGAGRREVSIWPATVMVKPEAQRQVFTIEAGFGIYEHPQ